MPAGESATKILIVEDNPIARLTSEDYLTDCGFQVVGVPHAHAAREACKTFRPDVAVCDWQLGAGPDGTEVAAWLIAEFGTHIIMMTGQPLEQLSKALGDTPVRSLLRKPLSLETLEQEILATQS